MLRSDRLMPRAVALAVALGFVLAEWTSLHHLDPAACVDARGGSQHAADGAWDRGDDSARLDTSEALALGELAGDLCHLCRSSRERLASPASAIDELAKRPLTPGPHPAQVREAHASSATYALAPKTSPPA